MVLAVSGPSSLGSPIGLDCYGACTGVEATRVSCQGGVAGRTPCRSFPPGGGWQDTWVLRRTTTHSSHRSETDEHQRPKRERCAGRSRMEASRQDLNRARRRRDRPRSPGRPCQPWVRSSACPAAGRLPGLRHDSSRNGDESGSARRCSALGGGVERAAGWFRPALLLPIGMHSSPQRVPARPRGPRGGAQDEGVARPPSRRPTATRPAGSRPERTAGATSSCCHDQKRGRMTRG